MVRRLTPPGREFFFGYYDKCPWDHSGRRVLVGETAVRGRLPRAEDALKVGWVEAEAGRLEFVAETKAWNFQQGAMAQWVVSDGEEHILYNSLSGGTATAIVMRPSGGGRRVLSFPVYSLSRDFALAASVDFGRLSVLRPGYGYAGLDLRGRGKGAPEDEGLAVYRMSDGLRVFFVSLRALADSIAPRGANSSHWVDHAEFSPDGQHLAFLHRWLDADGAPVTRVMCADLMEGSWRSLLDCGAAGHGVWLSAQEYGIWARLGRVAATVRGTTSPGTAPLRFALGIARQLLPAGFKRRIHSEEFLSVNIATGTVAVRMKAIPYSDRSGHPSLHPSGQWVVTDTLPDRSGRRRLFLASLYDGRTTQLARLTHEPATANSPYRCDLHPRWDRAGRRICIDSLHEGFRAMYEIDAANVDT